MEYFEDFNEDISDDTYEDAWYADEAMRRFSPEALLLRGLLVKSHFEPASLPVINIDDWLEILAWIQKLPTKKEEV